MIFLYCSVLPTDVCWPSAFREREIWSSSPTIYISVLVLLLWVKCRWCNNSAISSLSFVLEHKFKFYDSIPTILYPNKIKFSLAL